MFIGLAQVVNNDLGDVGDWLTELSPLTWIDEQLRMINQSNFPAIACLVHIDAAIKKQSRFNSSLLNTQPLEFLLRLYPEHTNVWKDLRHSMFIELNSINPNPNEENFTRSRDLWIKMFECIADALNIQPRQGYLHAQQVIEVLGVNPLSFYKSAICRASSSSSLYTLPNSIQY